jgi:hypothetical protein
MKGEWRMEGGWTVFRTRPALGPPRVCCIEWSGRRGRLGFQVLCARSYCMYCRATTQGHRPVSCAAQARVAVPEGSVAQRPAPKRLVRETPVWKWSALSVFSGRPHAKAELPIKCRQGMLRRKTLTGTRRQARITFRSCDLQAGRAAPASNDRVSTSTRQLLQSSVPPELRRASDDVVPTSRLTPPKPHEGIFQMRATPIAASHGQPPPK